MTKRSSSVPGSLSIVAVYSPEVNFAGILELPACKFLGTAKLILELRGSDTQLCSYRHLIYLCNKLVVE